MGPKIEAGNHGREPVDGRTKPNMSKIRLYKSQNWLIRRK